MWAPRSVAASVRLAGLLRAGGRAAALSGPLLARRQPRAGVRLGASRAGVFEAYGRRADLYDGDVFEPRDEDPRELGHGLRSSTVYGGRVPELDGRPPLASSGAREAQEAAEAARTAEGERMRKAYQARQAQEAAEATRKAGEGRAARAHAAGVLAPPANSPTPPPPPPPPPPSAPPPAPATAPVPAPRSQASRTPVNAAGVQAPPRLQAPPPPPLLPLRPVPGLETPRSQPPQVARPSGRAPQEPQARSPWPAPPPPSAALFDTDAELEPAAPPLPYAPPRDEPLPPLPYAPPLDMELAQPPPPSPSRGAAPARPAETGRWSSPEPPPIAEEDAAWSVPRRSGAGEGGAGPGSADARPVAAHETAGIKNTIMQYSAYYEYGIIPQ